MCLNCKLVQLMKGETVTRLQAVFSFMRLCVSAVLIDLLGALCIVINYVNIFIQ